VRGDVLKRRAATDGKFRDAAAAAAAAAAVLAERSVASFMYAMRWFRPGCGSLSAWVVSCVVGVVLLLNDVDIDQRVLFTDGARRRCSCTVHCVMCRR